jgi:hypothetical protein
MKKYLFSPEVIIFLGLTFLYFFTRFFLLKNLPLFVDEAGYIHWAQLGFADPNQRLVSLGDGKQPLFIWLIIVIMQVVTNPLVAGRIAAILSGFGAAIGLTMLTYELFKNKWIALCSMFFYILCPFALITDRLAIYDTLVAAIALWSMYLSILLVKRLQLQYAFILAFSLGAGILNKSSGFLSIYLLPVTLLLFEGKNEKTKRCIKWVLYSALSVAIACLYYSVLFLSSGFDNITAKNNYFLNSPLSLLHANFLPLFIKNLTHFGQWIFLLITPSFLLLAVAGMFLVSGHKKEKLLLVATFLIEILGMALLGRDPLPRYIFFMTLFLLPVSSLGMWYVYNRFKKNLLALAALVILCISFNVYSEYKILTNLEEAPVPQITKIELVTSWSAGGGIGNIVKYLLAESTKHEILVVTDGPYGGMSNAAMDMYFFKNPAAERMSFAKFPREIPQDILEKSHQEPVFLFLTQLENPPKWPMHLVLSYEKGHGPNYVYLYQLDEK